MGNGDGGVWKGAQRELPSGNRGDVLRGESDRFEAWWRRRFHLVFRWEPHSHVAAVARSREQVLAAEEGLEVANVEVHPLRKEGWGWHISAHAR